MRRRITYVVDDSSDHPDSVVAWFSRQLRRQFSSPIAGHRANRADHSARKRPARSLAAPIIKLNPNKITSRWDTRRGAKCFVIGWVLEAAIGIEPMNKGFADLCLTTWLRRPCGGQK